MRRQGMLLVSDVIFLVLALLFFTILAFFIARQSSATSVLEEQSAKRIALVIDNAQPDTQIVLRVKDLIENKEEEFSGTMILVDDFSNIVKVQLSGESGFSYGFFNDLPINSKLEGEYLTLEVGHA